MVELSRKNRLFIPPALLVAMVTAVSLLPFISKAFNIDDILFLWTADQIQSNPFNFFGFEVNWYGFDMEMSAINKNPPLVSYYISLITYFFGWGEILIHLFFLIPAVSLSLGTCFLARSFCSAPHLPAFLLAFSPVFLVSSTTIMSDTTMMAFYVWAVFLWLKGLEKERPSYLLVSSFLIAFSALTKYFGATLIPLLLVYTLVERRKVDSSLIFLLIPVVILSGYEWLSHSLYSHGLISSAVSYASYRVILKSSSVIEKTLTGLSFAGGCLVGVAFFAPLLWSRRNFIFGTLALLILSISVLLSMGTVGILELFDGSGIRYGPLIQLALFICAGIHILILAIADVWENRNASSLLLFLWVIGVFLFASYLNWTISGRNLFPMLPAIAILVFRRINYLKKESKKSKKESKNLMAPSPHVPLFLAAMIAFLVAWADFSLANAQRSVANKFRARYSDDSRRVLFQGHWGFQYYMESAGFKAINFKEYKMERGDIIIVPKNNTNLESLNEQLFNLVGKDQVEISGWISVMHQDIGAGFYSSIWGPLPYAFTKVPPEEYLVYLLE